VLGRLRVGPTYGAPSFQVFYHMSGQWKVCIVSVLCLRAERSLWEVGTILRRGSSASANT